MSSAPSPNSHSSDEKSPPSSSTSSPPPKDSLSPPPTPPSPSKNDNSSSSPPSSGNKNKSSPPPPSSSEDNSPSPPHSSNNDSKPHHSTSTPPNTVTPSSDSVSSSDSGSSSHKTLVAGVILGIGFLLIVMMIICVVCSRRRKRKREKMQYYYGESSSHPGPKYYSNNTQQQSWHNQPQDHIVRINAQAGDGQGWRSPPPPPPHMLNSVDTSCSLSGQRGPPLPPPSPSMALGFNKSTFTYDELAAATNGFSQDNLLGQGGFGYVHKGVLPNGKEVAVKSLKLNSGQGEREFQAEVEIISRVHHRHLVSLVGYCIAGGQRMLVYEFVPNKTLEYHLHVNHLDWPTRLRIAIGSAKGLAYIHEDCHPRIIHRDIKAANILIDNNFEAMVADFGLAKLSSDNYTHVSTRVMGTFGYLAPEYASSGKLTEKSDVFSFGIMLLEIITGKQPVDHSTNADDSLVDWARPLLTRAIEEGIYDSLVDPRLENNFNTVEMARMIASAAACIRHSARKRPRMSQVVRALDGDVSLEDLNEGVKPGHSSVYNASAEYDANAYNADMIKFRKIALSSHEFLTGEHGTESSNDSQ